jgi:4-diphosphocytidyl-2-C-methyl-D-erythritol kinase
VTREPSEAEDGSARYLAPAKLNLCLYLGGTRSDGLHELVSLFEPLSLADVIEVRGAAEDSVVCPGVEGENLAERALRELRDAGWDHEPIAVRIEKGVPVAAGLGGGSADAAAVLRLARDEVEDLHGAALRIGADVPSQLEPVFSLVEGAGERFERLPDPAPHGVVLLPGGGGLATADVFGEADRQGLGRSPEELSLLRERIAAAAGDGASPLDYADLLVNDLEPAAVALRPDIEEALGRLSAAGAEAVFMTGSGPTACGIFESLADAQAAAAELDRTDAIACEGGRAP